MKTTEKGELHFDLSEPEGRMAMQRALKSLDMACVLFEIQHNLFRGIEENNTSIMIIDKINELMDEHGINLDDLIE